MSLSYHPGLDTWICRGSTVGMAFSQYLTSELGFPGDVICLRVLGQVIVVLSSLTAIKDLYEKRGELYADRPRMPIFEMCVRTSLYASLAPSADHLIMPDSEWIGYCQLHGEGNIGARTDGHWMAVSGPAR
jgi:hypothetical protein